MPLYLFIHPDTEEEKEVFQKMDEPHVYIDENGIEWRRVFTPTNFSVDGKVNPFSQKEFVDKTAKKGMTVGDMWDLSKEMSEKRKKVDGKDKVKEKYLKDYSKDRRGRKFKPGSPF